MRAVGFNQNQPISSETALVDIDLPMPEAKGRDLLVEIRAISVNPVDTKTRKNAVLEPGQYKVLGYDAAGVVKAVGPDVKLFKPGDEVYYAGAINRQGTNAEFHLVDERIVGPKPKTLSFEQAAALPLTAITAYETLFHRMRVQDKVASAWNAVLLIGGAGGVGSIAIQLLRELSDVTVIATGSRPETQDWIRQLGAHHVLDHSKPLARQIAELAIGAPAFVFSITETSQHIGDILELIAPQGRLGLIDDPKEPVDVRQFKRKALSIHWETMFARPVFQTADMIEQHKLLTQVAELVDAGKIKTTLSDVLGPINATNLKAAHALIESGKTRGKLVLSGF
ncbi:MULTISPECIES: zinc-binding alcohol dehydrogenase family protein [Rhizobiaceae]|jgi:zinc-binding alcohol dehydrogenase family protein|uniref:Zinc-type alcohol dehydrogenase-like protein n=1 Tax=Aliirhizobium cellulosilyticum TaxID=393664 RepID=A0A7W6S6Q8_9HYPH|nr:zinc-binding alcohol dehydrogenase family protein [Rhizobium cellulosilyticum]MBB4348119.1 zinc-binding alcohol dehydrogenase family protein [Rhizobium cellulosilyticum]MBB4411356.1 zinc-binding alcohol dehydrogenase family protein [Rhizobium cellulosilyticum]MBB4446045.1 zinc-binding alcohol dehydrogenase family protein [Rhizobium cellulosilyticum]